MTSENLEIVRQAYAATSRGDVEAVFERWDPEIVIDDPGRPDPTSPDGVHRGLDAARRHLSDWQEVFAETLMEPVEIFEARDDTVVVRVRASARGTGSGIVVENERYHVLRMRGGKVVGLAIRESRSDALTVAQHNESG